MFFFLGTHTLLMMFLIKVYVHYSYGMDNLLYLFGIF